MNKSESIGKLAMALSKAQGEFKKAVKDSSNPFFKSNYADLESCWDAVSEHLTKYELAVVQTFSFENGIDFLETILTHSSGEFISGKQRLVSKDQTAQGFGSAATYNRRYGLAAILGIVQTDDDANVASGKKAADGEKKEAGNGNGDSAQKSQPKGNSASVATASKDNKGSAKNISEAQRKRLWALMKKAEMPEEVLRKHIAEQYKYESTKDIHYTAYEAICNFVESWKVEKPKDIFE